MDHIMEEMNTSKRKNDLTKKNYSSQPQRRRIEKRISSGKSDTSKKTDREKDLI